MTVHFEDKVLTRLASAEARGALFSGEAGGRVARVLFGSDTPNEADIHVDHVQLGVASDSATRGRTQLQIHEAPWRAEGEVVLEAAAGELVDAVVRARLSLPLIAGSAPVTAVTGAADAWPDIALVQGKTWPSAEDLEAGLDPGLAGRAREEARRLALARLLSVGQGNGDAKRLERLEQLFAEAGVTGVAQFLAMLAARPAIGSYAIRFAKAAPDQDGVQDVPFTAAVVIDDLSDPAGAWRAIFARARHAQRTVRVTGQGTADFNGQQPRERVPVLLFVPATNFDDDDWPGGGAAGTAADKARKRQTAAAGWLADAGIVLVPVVGE